MWELHVGEILLMPSVFWLLSCNYGVKRLRSEPASCFRENENKKNEWLFGKVQMANFYFSFTTKCVVVIGQFPRLELFLKNCFIREIFL